MSRIRSAAPSRAATARGSSVAAPMFALAFVTSAGCASSSECEGEIAEGTDPAVDPAAFHDALVGHLRAAEPKGAGFAFSDARGELLGRGACGWSRDERGDRRAFTSRTHNNWGSVAKMLTAAAAIHAVDTTPGASLDDPFVDYLPARWRADLHPDFAAVTIRMLLQHKGGFGRDGEIYYLDEDGAVIDLLGERLSQPAERPVGVRSYSNISPILLQFVVAAMTDPAGMSAAEEALAVSSPGDEFSRDINLVAATIYTEYVQRHVLLPATASGSCNITDFEGHAYSYPDADSRRGSFPRRAFGGDHTDECAAGGWVLDPEGMLAVLSTLRHRDTILSASSYRLMENTAAVDDRLGYSQAPATGDGRAFCHGGTYHDIHAAVCSFPDGSQAVVNVNSEIAGGSSGLVSALVDAYERSRRP